MNNEEKARQYIPLVYKIAGKFKYTDYDELCSIGLLGLAKAINTYEDKKENSASFMTYAHHCIFNELARTAYKYPNNLSLNEMVREDVEYIDFLGYNYYNELSENVENMLNKRKLDYIFKKVKKRFSPDVVDSFNQYYGIGCTPKNQPQIAQIKGVSRATISLHVCRVRKYIKSLRLNRFN